GLCREMRSAVPQARLAPRSDRKEPAVGALLVELVEILRVRFEIVGVLGDVRLVLAFLRLVLGIDRKAKRAAQLAAELFEVERARIPLLVPQVVVADVAGERERAARRQR